MRLGDIITPARLIRAGKNEYPLLSMTMREGLVRPEEKFKKRVASVDISAYKVVKKNQLVVGFPIDEGVLAFQTHYPEAIVSPAYDIWDIDPNLEVDLKYLERYLRSPSALLFYRAKLRGTTARRRTLPDDIFLSLEVPFPVFSKQRHISATLDNVDAIRRKRQQALTLIDNLVKSQFIEMFGDPVTNPMGWELKRLGSIVKVRSSKRVYQKEQAQEGIPFLRVSDLVNKIANKTARSSLYISDKLFNSFKLSGYVPKAGDILVTTRGTLGLCYIVTDSDKFYFQDGMISWLEIKEQEFSSLFLSYMLQTNMVRRQIDQAAAGSTVGYLSLTALEGFMIPLPPLSLQNKFTALVEQADKSKVTMQRQLQEAESLKASLMQQFFCQA